MKNLLIKIASIATELDYAGLTKEAKQMDSILLKLATRSNEKPKFYTYRKNNEEIRNMNKQDRVILFFEVQRHLSELRNYLRQRQAEFGDKGLYTEQLRNQIKNYEESIERNPRDTLPSLYSDAYERKEVARIKNEIVYWQQDIKKIEDEIDYFTDYAKELNFDGAYDPNYDYDRGHRLKKRNILDKFLGRDPKRDPNF